jgi:hypothetical protein
MNLRYIKYNCGFFCLLLVGLASCKKDFLDQKNPLAISDEEVWSDPALINMYVNSIYNDVPGWDMGQLVSSIADESMVTYPTDASHSVLRGDWSAVQNPMEYWPYDRIRKCNEFFARINAASVDAAAKNTLKGEVRFLRAFQYYQLVVRYGGVPIITVPQKITDDLQVKRNTVDECFKFITAQLDSAANELPKDALRGKATKGAALALKGRAALFYASPLYNDAHDNERWKAAADASLAVMNLGKYDLNPDLKGIWLDETVANKEPIFEVDYALPQKYHFLDAIVKPLIIANNTAGYRCPYQELVDAYPMKNGKKISEGGSGYNGNDPYAGRDDRFYNDIAYNGSVIRGTASGPPVRDITLQIYKGGRDYDEIPGYQIYNTYTGYYSTKMINQENTQYRGGYGSTTPWLEIRYAEVLLNYAEAQNEYLSAPDASVYDAINKIRRRAGITVDIAAGSLNKESMRTMIQNERYVELSYECKRYWDLRRWKVAEQKLNGAKFTGVVITKQTNNSFTYEYKPAVTETGVFLLKMYFMPLPQSEITKNKNLVQNPGWQ